MSLLIRNEIIRAFSGVGFIVDGKRHRGERHFKNLTDDCGEEDIVEDAKSLD